MHFHFFPYKCLCDQIWPWPKVGQGHPRVTIYAIYHGPTPQMLHTKFHAYRPSGSREEDFWRVFIIYGHGSHLGHVTWTPYANFRSPIPWRLHMKFDFNRPSGSRGEDVWKCEHDTHTDNSLAIWQAHQCAFGSGELVTNLYSKMIAIFASCTMQKYTFRVCAESERPDQTVHLCSVIRTFTVAARITGYYRMYPWRATALTFLHIPQLRQAKIYLQGMCRKWMPRSDCASVQCDQDLYCLLPESLDTIECIHGEQLPWWDWAWAGWCDSSNFAHAQRQFFAWHSPCCHSYEWR